MKDAPFQPGAKVIPNQGPDKGVIKTVSKCNKVTTTESFIVIFTDGHWCPAEFCRLPTKLEEALA